MYVQACASLLAICIAKNDLWKIKVIQEFYQQLKGELARAEQEGLFKRERQIVSEQDAVISDALNHASIIDGIGLCQSAALPLCQQRYGGAGSAPAAGGQSAPYFDRYRRGVLGTVAKILMS
ncbi:hypothetical protein BBW68_12605 [Candidatus Erwinia dacicola]|uniref:Uncharacterized protein n=1 Tax=Candidatus Erwinia dacicola TaxID=252393 RepID=A0A1E7YY81_9GAMM|nr:hypothetical protein BBW68_12605 [Candidatus Erwinia dacicola]RAP70922.1 hypothetical protein ACZ87_02275 [Candidatus Erwinia dacicola]